MSNVTITNSKNAVGVGGSVSDSVITLIADREILDKELETLRAQVDDLLNQLPADKKEAVKGDLERFSTEVQSKKPDPRYFQVSAKGLTDAAKAVGDAAPPILATVKGILKLIGFASMVL